MISDTCCSIPVHKAHTALDGVCCCGTVAFQKMPKIQETFVDFFERNAELPLRPSRTYLKVRKSKLGMRDWLVLKKDDTGTQVVARFDEHGCALRFAVNYAQWGGPRV